MRISTVNENCLKQDYCLISIYIYSIVFWIQLYRTLHKRSLEINNASGEVGMVNHFISYAIEFDFRNYLFSSTYVHHDDNNYCVGCFFFFFLITVIYNTSRLPRLLGRISMLIAKKMSVACETYVCTNACVCLFFDVWINAMCSKKKKKETSTFSFNYFSIITVIVNLTNARFTQYNSSLGLEK